MAGGGTGGHLFPGLALARELQRQRPDTVISFIGTAHGLDLEIVPRAGFPIDVLAAGRGSPLSRIRPDNLPRFIISIFQSRKLIKKYRPDVIVALGGFAAAAPGIAARFSGVPLVVLEQNSVPGRVNRLLARWAKKVFLQFRCARDKFLKSTATFYDFGSPVRRVISKLADKKPCSGNSLLIVGGSQGARKLNELVIDAVPDIVHELGCEVIHVAGAGNEIGIRHAYEERNVDVTVHGFFTEMEECYNKSRLVISRSGAGSIAELALAGLPSILIPLPTAMDNHQLINAKVMEGAGGALVLEQDALTPESLARQVIRLWKDAAALETMADASRRTARPFAAQEIAGSIIEMVES